MSRNQGTSSRTRRTLSPARQHLVHTLQWLNFGKIEQLSVRDGEPTCTDGLRIVREVKFGGENGPRPEAALDDFLLKAQVVELFEYFDRVRDCDIDVLDVKHGLPFRMLVRGET